MDNIRRQQKSMCQPPDIYRQVEGCRIPVPKQYLSENLGNGTIEDRIRQVDFQTSRCSKLH